MHKTNITSGTFWLHFSQVHHVFSQIATREWEDNNNNNDRLQRCVGAADSAEFINAPPAKCRHVAPPKTQRVGQNKTANLSSSHVEFVCNVSSTQCYNVTYLALFYTTPQ